MQKLLRTASCLVNTPLTSQVLDQNLYRTKSILYHTQVLKGTVNSATCRKVSKHSSSFYFSITYSTPFHAAPPCVCLFRLFGIPQPGFITDKWLAGATGAYSLNIVTSLAIQKALNTN